MVEREGFEPSKAYAGRFTVCSLWPLGHLSPAWSRWPESNWQPTDYKSVALPLSYIGPRRIAETIESGMDTSAAWRETCFLPATPRAVKVTETPCNLVHGHRTGNRGIERLDPAPEGNGRTQIAGLPRPADAARSHPRGPGPALGGRSRLNRFCSARGLRAMFQYPSSRRSSRQRAQVAGLADGHVVDRPCGDLFHRRRSPPPHRGAGMTTAAIPTAAAVRISAPRLCGS